MTVQLLHYTPLWVASTAIRKCWASEDKSDTKEIYTVMSEFDEDGEFVKEYQTSIKTCGPKDKELIERVGNKNKHASTLEHLNYSFDIDGISRACLQELARHRMASLSVKSTRYTLKELRNEEPFEDYHEDISRANKYIVYSDDCDVDECSMKALENLRQILNMNTGNDVAKYCLPESYITSLVWTVNARALQNFLSLRTDKSALWEIQDLARKIFNQLPEEHKYLFVDYVK
jgi:thymidylate synthase (FAD)